MRRSLTWLTALPLMLAGSQAAHVLAYRWVYPDAPVRLHELLATGHSYLDYAPVAFGLGGASFVTSLLWSVAEAARGRAPRGLPPWAFALLPPLGFVLQEHLERWLHTGVFPSFTVLDPTFLPGLALQLPFAAAAFLVARLLLRTTERLGRAFASAAAPLLRCALLPRLRPLQAELPRLTGSRRWRTERGPPASAPA